jgi:hypothetical protein
MSLNLGEFLVLCKVWITSGHFTALIFMLLLETCSCDLAGEQTTTHDASHPFMSDCQARGSHAVGSCACGEKLEEI